MDYKSLEIGGIIVIAVGLIEVIKLLINKYAGKPGNDWNRRTYEQLANHQSALLTDLKNDINAGNDRICQGITEMRLDLSNKLTETTTILKEKKGQ